MHEAVLLNPYFFHFGLFRCNTSDSRVIYAIHALEMVDTQLAGNLKLVFVVEG